MAKPARELPQFHSLSSVREGAERRSSPDGSVNATTAGRHLDLSYQRVLQLVEEGALQQLPNGRFDLDDCRLRYIRWLRDPERRTAKSKADQEFTQAKADLIRIRIAEKQRDLILYSEAEETGDKMIGIVLTKLSGLSARVGGDQVRGARPSKSYSKFARKWQMPLPRWLTR